MFAVKPMGGHLRFAATALALLVRSRNGEGAAVVALAITLAALVEAATCGTRVVGWPQAVAARQASSHLRQARPISAPVLGSRTRVATQQAPTRR